MDLQLQQRVFLVNGQGGDLGQVVIERTEGDLVFGRFTPGPAFSHVEPLFAEYVEAANQQLLSVVGDLDAKISALGLHLGSPEGTSLPAIYDIQIGAGIITFRIGSASEAIRNGSTIKTVA